jgi:hypothetical protein
MQNDVNKFVVNIIPLQNIQTTTSGLDTNQALSNSVANLQQMVNFDQKRIYTDSIASFTSGGSITVLNNLALSNATITSNGASVIGSGGTSLSNGATFLTLSQTTTSIGYSNTQGLLVQSNGDVTVGGTCFAQAFVTLSDQNVKKNIKPWNPSFMALSNIKTYSFTYAEGANSDDKHYGLIAQEVESVYPEAVKEVNGVKSVNYQILTAILLNAVSDLQKKVQILEYYSNSSEPLNFFQPCSP